jgi:hypothetical protein
MPRMGTDDDDVFMQANVGADRPTTSVYASNTRLGRRMRALEKLWTVDAPSDDDDASTSSSYRKAMRRWAAKYRSYDPIDCVAEAEGRKGRADGCPPRPDRLRRLGSALGDGPEGLDNDSSSLSSDDDASSVSSIVGTADSGDSSDAARRHGFWFDAASWFAVGFAIGLSFGVCIAAGMANIAR